MIAGLEVWVLLAIAATVVVGAAVQGLVGLGVGLVSAPVVTILAPDLMPVTLLVVGLLTPLTTLLRDHHGIDWRGVGWALPMRVPGTAVGVWLVSTVSRQALGVLVGVVVLATVVLTWRRLRLRMTRTNLALAGLLSGAGAATTSIGGPPLALLYQHEPPHTIRSTLAVHFTGGALVALVGLAWGGQMSGEQVQAGLLLAPCVLAGIWAAGHVRRALPTDEIRLGVLLVCAASALLLVARSLA